MMRKKHSPEERVPGTAIGEHGDIWATSLGEMKNRFVEYLEDF